MFMRIHQSLMSHTYVVCTQGAYYKAMSSCQLGLKVFPIFSEATEPLRLCREVAHIAGIGIRVIWLRIYCMCIGLGRVGNDRGGHTYSSCPSKRCRLLPETGEAKRGRQGCRAKGGDKFQIGPRFFFFLIFSHASV